MDPPPGRLPPAAASPKVVSFAAPKPRARPKATAPVRPVPKAPPIDDRLRAFKERLNEHGMNDYADKDDDRDIDDDTLIAMSLKAQNDPDGFEIFTPETRAKMEERDRAFDSLREAEMIRRGDLPPDGRRRPVDFEEAVLEQAKHHKIGIEVVAQPNEQKPSAKQQARRQGYETAHSNRMIARDPEEDLVPDRLVGRHPRPVGPEMNPYELPHRPEVLLENPDLLSRPAAQKVLLFLQKYQIKAARQRYTEADITDTFCRDITNEVSDLHRIVKTGNCIMCVYLVFTPLCIHCKFKRVVDKSTAKLAYSVYVWEGYAFTELMSEEEEKKLKEKAMANSTKLPMDVHQ